MIFYWSLLENDDVPLIFYRRMMANDGALQVWWQCRGSCWPSCCRTSTTKCDRTLVSSTWPACAVALVPAFRATDQRPLLPLLCSRGGPDLPAAVICAPPSYLRSALPYVRLWSAFYISGLHMIYGLNCLHCCCCSWMSPVRQQHQVWHIILNAEFIICNAEIIISFKCRSHHALSICDKPDHTPSTAACHCRPFPRAHAVACSQSFSLLAWCHVRMTSSTKSSPSTSPAATRCDFILRNDEFCI